MLATSLPGWTLCRQQDAVPQQAGYYASFPSLAQDPLTGEVVLLFRRAMYNEADERPGMTAHGLDGNLYIKHFNLYTQAFSEETLLYAAKDYEPGLIDGFLSALGDTLHVCFRRFPNAQPVFVAKGPGIHHLQVSQVFPAQTVFNRGAQWGRMVSPDGGKTLLQAYYGGTSGTRSQWEAGLLERPVTRPGVFQSVDGGNTWTFLSWITPLFLEPGMTANETTLVTASGKVFALSRIDGEYPGPMFLTCSQDGGRTWDTPRRSGLYGEAPMFYTLPTGDILVGFRGYRPEDPTVGGTYEIARFNPATGEFCEPFVVEVYEGNHYDGGYGDLIWLAETEQLLVVYYYSNQQEPRNPWLRYSILRMEKGRSR